MSYEIIDNKGVIYSGDYDEMYSKFYDMIAEDSEETWYGDLKLVEVLEISR